jgi:hypothetical protein
VQYTQEDYSPDNSNPGEQQCRNHERDDSDRLYNPSINAVEQPPSHGACDHGCEREYTKYHPDE